MGFFGILFRWWSLIVFIFVTWKPNIYSSKLSLTWKDSLIWGFESIITIFEIYCIYLIFKIIFLKPLPFNKDVLSPRDYLKIMHIYHAMLVCSYTVCIVRLFV